MWNLQFYQLSFFIFDIDAFMIHFNAIVAAGDFDVLLTFWNRLIDQISAKIFVINVYFDLTFLACQSNSFNTTT